MSRPSRRTVGILALMQMLWDCGEGSGYAHRTTDDPLPNTAPHNVLLHAAFGDHQVANVAAEVHARSAGARLLQTSLAPGRHWAHDPPFGLDTFDVAGEGSLVSHAGSALVSFDSGNPDATERLRPSAHHRRRPARRPAGRLPQQRPARPLLAHRRRPRRDRRRALLDPGLPRAVNPNCP